MVASRQDVECALLWKLVRSHGWSNEVAVQDLVDDANVQDETQGRDVARNQLATRDFIGYHGGKDTIWVTGPPSDEIAYHLRDECGYSEIQIEATFKERYFSGF